MWKPRRPKGERAGPEPSDRLAEVLPFRSPNSVNPAVVGEPLVRGMAIRWVEHRMYKTDVATGEFYLYTDVPDPLVFETLLDDLREKAEGYSLLLHLVEDSGTEETAAVDYAAIRTALERPPDIGAQGREGATSPPPAIRWALSGLDELTTPTEAVVNWLNS